MTSDRLLESRAVALRDAERAARVVGFSRDSLDRARVDVVASCHRVARADAVRSEDSAQLHASLTHALERQAFAEAEAQRARHDYAHTLAALGEVAGERPTREELLRLTHGTDRDTATLRRLLAALTPGQAVRLLHAVRRGALSQQYHPAYRFLGKAARLAALDVLTRDPDEALAAAARHVLALLLAVMGAETRARYAVALVLLLTRTARPSEPAGVPTWTPPPRRSRPRVSPQAPPRRGTSPAAVAMPHRRTVTHQT